MKFDIYFSGSHKKFSSVLFHVQPLKSVKKNAISMRLLTSGIKEFDWVESRASVIMTDAKNNVTEPCSVHKHGVHTIKYN